MNRLARHFVYTLAVLVMSSEVKAQGIAIAGIEGKLFYSNSGRLSANIIGNPKVVLHNVVIGEGTVDGPSENTLLVVKLHGPAKSFVEGLVLRITATAQQDTLADRVIEVGAMNSAGNYYAPCWLNDTGCSPVEVEVQLKLGREVRRAKALIPFLCAE